MNQLLIRSGAVFAIIIVSLLLFAPNFLEQELEIVFRKEYRLEKTVKTKKDGKEKEVKVTETFQNDPAVIKDFVVDRENGLGIYFTAPCSFVKMKSKDGKDTGISQFKCRLKERFITAARINEMTQSHPELIDDLRTTLLPHGLERFFGFLSYGDFKNLKIRLGLDLQGGMRATFKGDYRKYAEVSMEKREKTIETLYRKTKNPTLPQKDRDDAREQLEIQREALLLNDEQKRTLLFEARKIIDERLANLNISEPEVRVQPDSYSIGVDMPGVTNSSTVLRKIQETVTVEYRIVNAELSDKANALFGERLRAITRQYRNKSKVPVDEEDIRLQLNEMGQELGLKAGEGRIFLKWMRGKKAGSAKLPRQLKVCGPPVMDGSDMTTAALGVDQNGDYQINFELSSDGASKFKDITANNIGKGLAILWGGKVVTDPRINGVIPGGRGEITGQFTQQEANDIVAVIKEGALPLPLNILSLSFIGPSLGQDSIVAGIVSIVLGFVLVILFMIGYYKVSGLIANFALLLNVLLIAAILSLLEFTLTLPGFAGIILTVGMAVDANVIIFEKIKEELRHGKAPSIAVESGYESSLWTILDANVTTIIAAVILWYVGKKFGDSAIMGFSITLFCGLVSSMFTSLVVSRLLFDWLLKVFKPKQLSIGYGFGKQAS